MKGIKLFFLISFVNSVIQVLVPDPWWIFLISTFFIGLICAKTEVQIPFFILGFLSGFVVWAGGFTLFHLMYQGDIVNRLAAVIESEKIAIVLITGVVGGLLNGLSLFSGVLLRAQRNNHQLELSSDYQDRNN